MHTTTTRRRLDVIEYINIHIHMYMYVCMHLGNNTFAVQMLILLRLPDDLQIMD